MTTNSIIELDWRVLPQTVPSPVVLIDVYLTGTSYRLARLQYHGNMYALLDRSQAFHESVTKTFTSRHELEAHLQGVAENFVAKRVEECLTEEEKKPRPALYPPSRHRRY